MTGKQLYIHEFVQIRDHGRADYMQHMTANWSPIGQGEREQLCYGVFGTVGSTGVWPEVVNMWEYRDWAHLGENFRIEMDHPTLQDPSLADWWAEAVRFRRGGFDRILVGADYNPGIEALCREGRGGHAYLHEMVRLRSGGADGFLEAADAELRSLYGEHGLDLIGAFKTAMVDDDECLLLWSVPDWAAWAGFEEAAHRSNAPLAAWRNEHREHVVGRHRTLLVAAPLCPLKLGRQPAESDRRPLS